jgi:RNase adapter protein RapZ
MAGKPRRPARKSARSGRRPPPAEPGDVERSPKTQQAPELVIITGFSGSGKGTVLKSLEDIGFYSVDNLPVELIPKFAELTNDSPKIRRAALVVDVREGASLQKFPSVLTQVRSKIPTTLLFLEADQDTLFRRYSETRRPHPLGDGESVLENIKTEREVLQPLRDMADLIVSTSKFNVHELRHFMHRTFSDAGGESKTMIYVTSFGFRHGIPADSDLVFDVRFLPNPNYIPEFKNLTGRNPRVAQYIRSYPQTVEFIERISQLLVYLLPHYVREGKSYLTISFGCTGGRHRSVMMAAEIGRRIAKAGYRVKTTHRDVRKS